MARPAILQKLQHDKVLTKANFPDFVETFNYSVNRIENIKGDKEIDFVNGHITVDDTDPEHPVIRWQKGLNELKSQKHIPEPFDFDSAQNKIVNCLWYMGRQVRQLTDYSVDLSSDATYWLKIETDQYGQFSQCSIMSSTYVVPVNGGSFSAPANTSSETYYPLWSLTVLSGEATPTFDWRTAWKTPFYST